MPPRAPGPPPRARIGLLELDRGDDLLDLQSGLGAGALVCLAIDPDQHPVDIDDPDPVRRAQLGGVTRKAFCGRVPEVEVTRVAAAVLAHGSAKTPGGVSVQKMKPAPSGVCPVDLSMPHSPLLIQPDVGTLNENGTPSRVMEGGVAAGRA